MIGIQNTQILGVGIDLVDVQRIEKMIVCYGFRFLYRIFTEKEREYARSHLSPGTAYAKRFAAKEAFSKAVGCGIGKILSFQDIEVTHNTKGQPVIVLSDPCYERVSTFLGCSFTSFLSLTDEYPYAQAFALVSQVGP